MSEKIDVLFCVEMIECVTPFLCMGRRILKRNIFRKVARVDHSFEVPGSFFDEAGSNPQ